MRAFPSGPVLIAAIIAVVNVVVACFLYETAGWFFIRGYREVTRDLIYPAILLQAVMNLVIGLGVLGLAGERRSAGSRAAARSLMAATVLVPLTLLFAPGVGQWLKRRLLLPTPLIEAARYGDADLVMRKVAAGEAPDQRHNALDTTPLHYMAMGDHEEAVAILLAKGADPNAQARPSMETPLHFAVSRPTEAGTVRVLVQYGANPHLRDWEGRSPIRQANLLPEPKMSEFLAIFGSAPIGESARAAQPQDAPD